METSVSESQGFVSVRTLAITCLVYGISIILISIYPVLAGLYIDHLGLSLSQAGWTLSIEQAGGIVGAIAGFFLAPRFSWRTIIVVASVVALLANALTAVAHNLVLLLIFRFGSGVGVLIVTTVTACILARARHPDRAFGAGLGTGMLLAAFAIWIIELLKAQESYAHALGSAAGWFTVALILAVFLPRSLGGKTDQNPPHNKETQSSVSAVMGRAGLVGLVLYGISVNVLWGFLERVGLDNGLSGVDVAAALGFGLVFSAAGSLIPLVFGAWGGRLKWIAGTTVVLLVSLVILANSESVVSFTIGIAMLASAWNMGLAYYMALISQNDPAGRYTRLMYVAIVFAQAVGPAIAAVTLTNRGLSAIFTISPLPAVIAFFIVLVVAMMQARRTVGKTQNKLGTVPTSSA